MTLQPDHPDFTAALLGETPLEKAEDFQQAIATDSRSLAESLAIRSAADRLRRALKSDPALSHQLTSAQRAAVFAPSSGIRAVPSGNSSASGAGSTKAPAAASIAIAGGRPVRRSTVKKSWFLSGPALATAGIAAAVAFGVIFLSGPSPDSTAGPLSAAKSSAGSPSASRSSKAGIPVIALEAGTPASAPANPGVPSPVVPPIPSQDPMLLPGIPLDNPASSGPQTAPIATSPPAIRLTPAGMPPAPETGTRGSLTEIVPAPGAPPRRGGMPAGTLTSPGGR